MKISTSSIHRLWLVALVLCPPALAQTIPVNNVEELYSAVNESANAGATLVLAEGKYVLSALDPSNSQRPNGGRIEFQRDMTITGVEGDRTLVVIDALNLPKPSFPTTNGPNAAIRMGLGHNTLQWLTVRDAVNGQANIDTGLQPLDPADTSIVLAHIASTGSARGANILNFGVLSSNQTIDADISDCDFFDNANGLSEGIRMGNFSGTVGGTVNVRMSGNRSWGQKQGRFIVNNTASKSKVNVISSGNQFYGNGAGTIIIGGLTTGLGRADGNAISFEARGDVFLRNTGPTEFDHGGLVVLGADNISTVGGGGSNNTVDIKLWGVRTAGNDQTDLYGVGARSNFVPGVDPTRNQNNHVTITITGSPASGPWKPVKYFHDSLPDLPAEGNSITVINSP